MLRIKRLRTVDDPAFAPAMALYAASFPNARTAAGAVPAPHHGARAVPFRHTA